MQLVKRVKGVPALRRFASEKGITDEEIRHVFEQAPLKPLPEGLKQRADAAAATYNRNFQKREYRMNADLADKIHLMHRAIAALPTARMRELAREDDNSVFPMERQLPTHYPPPFQEYPDETGEGYVIRNLRDEVIDPKDLGMTVFQVFERTQSRR